MPDARLQRARESLPEGYQFGAALPGGHHHDFNPISGCCACGLRYVPYLKFKFPNGGRVVNEIDGTFERFITDLDQAGECS